MGSEKMNSNTFPEGLSVANGRFRLTSLQRGLPHNGVWFATDTETTNTVITTLRYVRYTEERRRKLSFSAYRISKPLFVGPPDLYQVGGETVRDAHMCVVDEIPAGNELGQVGRIGPLEAAALGVALCDVITTWAASCDGYVLRGLRPETIFMQGVPGARALTGIIPRPYFLLGNRNSFEAYPDLTFDPPSLDTYELDSHDGLFTIALLIWYAVTGRHPYEISGTDIENNECHDIRIPFEGPPALGTTLERALLADRRSRISISEFRDSLCVLL
jgi:hypothetical protein